MLDNRWLWERLEAILEAITAQESVDPARPCRERVRSHPLGEYTHFMV